MMYEYARANTYMSESCVCVHVRLFSAASGDCFNPTHHTTKTPQRRKIEPSHTSGIMESTHTCLPLSMQPVKDRSFAQNEQFQEPVPFLANV